MAATTSKCWWTTLPGTRAVQRLERVMVEQTSPGTTGAVHGQEGRRFSGGVIATLVGVGLLLVFMIQNTAPVTLHFLFWSWSWSLWLFTLVTALLAALV
jgi:uncharacterized integral membrane protein